MHLKNVLKCTLYLIKVVIQKLLVYCHFNTHYHKNNNCN